jgi:hypothetical protein
VRRHSSAPSGKSSSTAGLRLEFDSSRRGAVVIVQHAAQALMSLQLAGFRQLPCLRADEPVAKPW